MTRDACNLCGGETLAPVLDLGALPLPNNLYAAADASMAAPRYPLTLATCEACGLAQLLDAVPPAEMFCFYRYTPSASAVLTDHFRRLASTARRRLRLMPGERVVDIGSNDGLLLRLFREVCGSDVLGVDPAENLARTANASGVRTLNAFWEDLPAAAAGRARLVVSTNCLGHTSRLAEFLSGVHDALAPGGYFLFEVPYLADLVAGLQYDTIYHEHQTYFGLRPLLDHLPRFGLRPARAERVAVHGGSLRVWCQKRPFSEEAWWNGGEAASLLRREAATKQGLRSLPARVVRHRAALRRLVESLSGRDALLYGFGASAKATVLVNHAGIGERLHAVVDASPLKQGLYLPGTALPVLPEAAARDADYVIDFIRNLRRDLLDKLTTWETPPRVIELFPRPRVAKAPTPRARLLEAATL